MLKNSITSVMKHMCLNIGEGFKIIIKKMATYLKPLRTPSPPQTVHNQLVAAAAKSSLNPTPQTLSPLAQDKFQDPSRGAMHHHHFGRKGAPTRLTGTLVLQVFNRPSVAGAVLRTPTIGAWRRRKDIFTNYESLNQSVTKVFVEQPQLHRVCLKV